MFIEKDHKRKREDEDEDDARSAAKSKSTCPLHFFLTCNVGRMLKIVFVEDGSNNVIGKPAAAFFPTGTPLNDAKNIISSASSMQPCEVVRIEWQGVPLNDALLDGVRHGETVVAVMQKQRNKKNKQKKIINT